MSQRIVIVGGGIIGTACAHYLLERGCRVTIIERGRFGSACSHGNCGLVCPSHVLPLAEPGAIGRAMKSMFQRNSPFHIKPRLDPALWSWLWNFARRCNEQDMMQSARAIHALLHSSMNLYPALIEKYRLDCEWERRGLLFAYREASALDEFEPTNRLLSDAFEEPARRLNGDEMVRFEPALKPGLAGGWYYDSDAHLRPDKLLTSWRSSLEARGVAILEGCEMRRFSKAGGIARAVETSAEAFEADQFIIAAGSWTPLLARELGCAIPIQPGKGYSITMPRPAVCPNVPVIFPETRVAVTPMKSVYRLGSMMEFAGYDTSIRPERLKLLKDGAEPYLREPFTEPFEEEWYGWRPMTPDSVPIIGRSPAMSNVLIVSGHNMLGLSMAPGTGKLVAEMLTGECPHVDPLPYAVGRF